VNPRFHEDFVALCALFYSDEISDEEWALLQVHLAYCDSCRALFEQYKQVSDDVIPAMAAAAAEESSPYPYESQASLDAAESRLMGSLNGESKSKSRIQSIPVARKRSWVAARGALAACILVAVVAFAWSRVSRTKAGSSEISHTTAVTSALLPPGPVPLTSPEISVQQHEGEIAKLREQIAAMQQQSQRSDSVAKDLREQIAQERAEKQQLASDRDSLRQQLASVQTDAQDLRTKLAVVQANADQGTARTATLDAEVTNLRGALSEAKSALDTKERMLALDQDFLAHDRDIRDLIGARNLYISDIFDTNADGKTAKPFGRIFYTEDRSLVFYGFDLDQQPGLKRAVAFQVWGSGSDRQPVSLGLFYQDAGHKRWVLRFDDAKTLARLNMVFVTVEPAGGSNKPTGKQMLRAFLQIQPNHP